MVQWPFRWDHCFIPYGTRRSRRLYAPGPADLDTRGGKATLPPCASWAVLGMPRATALPNVFRQSTF
jgi:hypothetical protein